MHIKNATYINHFFKYKKEKDKESKFDFMKYYEEVTRAPASLLTQLIF